MTSRRRADRTRRAILIAFALGALHYCATLASLLGAAIADGETFDVGQRSPIGEPLSAAAEVFAFPIAHLASTSHRRLPSIAQHAILAANSLLWGAALYGLWRILRAIRREPRGED
jgi:hypothetical protein